MVRNLELIAVNHIFAAIFILWSDAFLSECEPSGLRSEWLAKVRVWACHRLLIREVILTLTHNTEILYILVFN